MSWTSEAITLCANPVCTQPKRHGGECDSNTPTYAQAVTRLAREWNASAVNERVSKQVAAATFSELEDAAERAGISQDDATDDLYSEIDADGPGAR